MEKPLRERQSRKHSAPLPTVEYTGRRPPVLIRNWDSLWTREFIELRRGLNIVGTGWVDSFTPDASIVWIQLDNGLGRILLHRDDGIDIWRVEARILQDRPHANSSPDLWH